MKCVVVFHNKIKSNEECLGKNDGNICKQHQLTHPSDDDTVRRETNFRFHNRLVVIKFLPTKNLVYIVLDRLDTYIFLANK